MFISSDQLFPGTPGDIRKRLRSKKEYDLLRAAAMCRQLLSDGPNSLALIVNRNRKIKLIFKISELSKVGAHRMWGDFVWVTVNPSKISKTVEVNLSTFLAVKPLRAGRHAYSVNEIIRGCSNFMGGVHRGAPNDQKDKVLDQIEFKTKGDHDTIRIALVAICKVILKALLPLEKSIKQNFKS